MDETRKGFRPSSLRSLENGVEPSPSRPSDLRRQAGPHQNGERGSVRTQDMGAPDGAGSRICDSAAERGGSRQAEGARGRQRARAAGGERRQKEPSSK